jgi:hypothetical protein
MKEKLQSIEIQLNGTPGKAVKQIMKVVQQLILR